jgi:ribonuclease E|tara:strand:- start:828 stop:2939 length:2112 start_codon:yes stop_codon:yes gene_type:complete
MKRILINATQQEELRVAMVDGQKLYDLDIELSSKSQKKNNIYKGKITRVEPSLDSVFVDFGSTRNGFLPYREISREYYLSEPIPGEKHNIKNLFEEGQDIVVQVVKEERGTKGAALTTYLSLAGRFIVLMPNSSKGGGVSRKIIGKERSETLESLSDLEIPDGTSMIIRTAGVGRASIELQWDLNYLVGIWDAIKKLALKVNAPSLIFQENNLIVRAMRDHLEDDIGEIVIDDDSTFDDAAKYVKQITPKNLKKLKHYKEPTPLFTRFQIENQIESAYSNEVSLPSGGSVVIDYTEALVAIDINSGKSTKASDIEATALQTNIEAAEEIARQCRLRDLGGLIVIDFIDMRQYKNQRAVENTLKAAVRIDRARVSIGGISKFGLLEMSRQRLRPSLDDSAYGICRNCSGIGKVRSTESLALSVLRLVGEEARKEKTKSVIADIPSDTANYLLKEKSDWINDIEEREKIDVVLKANPNLSSVNFSIKRVREDDSTTTTYGKPSFGVSEKDLRPNANKNKSAVVKTKQTNEQEPITAWNVDDVKGPTLIDRLKFWILSAKKPKVKTKQTKAPRKNRNNQRRVRKPHSKNTRKKQPSHSKSKKPNASKHAANKKKSVSKKPPASKTKKAPSPVKGVKPAKKAKETKKTANPKNKEAKVNQKKLPAKKATKQPKKIVKNSKKEPANKVSKKITTSDKVLPWEDIVPPK